MHEGCWFGSLRQEYCSPDADHLGVLAEVQAVAQKSYSAIFCASDWLSETIFEGVRVAFARSEYLDWQCNV